MWVPTRLTLIVFSSFGLDLAARHIDVRLREYDLPHGQTKPPPGIGTSRWLTKEVTRTRTAMTATTATTTTSPKTTIIIPSEHVITLRITRQAALD